MWNRIRDLSKMGEARELCNRLLEHIFPPVPVPNFPKDLFASGCSWDLRGSSLCRLQTIEWCCHHHNHHCYHQPFTVSSYKDATCCEAFAFLPSSCLWCCTFFPWCFCHAASVPKKIFRHQRYSPYCLSKEVWISHGKEDNLEGSYASVLQKSLLLVSVLAPEPGGGLAGIHESVLHDLWISRLGLACPRTTPKSAEAKAEDRLHLLSLPFLKLKFVLSHCPKSVA